MNFEGLDYPHKCHECGRFMTVQPGCAWKMVYSGGPIPMPDREIFRCADCTKRHGGFPCDAGIKPECSAGFVQRTIAESGEMDG